MGGRGGSSGGGGGGFSGLEIERVGRNGDIQFQYLAKNKDGTNVVRQMNALRDSYVRDMIKKRREHVRDNSILPKNFFDKARELLRKAKDSAEREKIWNDAQRAYRKALRREQSRI